MTHFIKSQFLDRKFRVPRKWSNDVLRKIGQLLEGKIVNVSGWRDEDKEGRTYKEYFPFLTEYYITNYKKEARGFQGDLANEIFLDLEQPLSSDLVGAFEVVLNHTVLEHVFEVQKAFENLCSMSNDLVIVIVPFLQEQHADYGDFWRFTPLTLQRLFEKNSLELLYLNYNDSTTSSIYILAVGSKHGERWPKLKAMEGNKISEIKNVFVGTKIIRNTVFYRLFRNLTKSAQRKTSE